MTRIRVGIGTFVLGAAVGVAPSAVAQTYTIPWFTVDGGAARSTAGPYAITGTAGQPDAGLLASPGELTTGYAVKGGFWSWTTSADQHLVVTDSIDPAAVLTDFSYSLTVTNQGPETATGVTLVNTLASGATFESASAGCSHAGGVVTCALGNLAPGADRLATIVVQASLPDTLTNSALVYSDAVDIDPADDTASEATQVMVPRLLIGDLMIAEGDSGSNPATFSVTLTPPSGQTVTVAYATLDDTATAGSDYGATQGTLTFGPLETNKPVPVLVLGDTIAESNEVFQVVLGSPVNAAIHDGLGEGTILDNEGLVGGTTTFVSIADAPPVAEGNAGSVLATFTLAQTGPWNPAATVSWTTSAGGNATPGADFTPASGVVGFGTGPSQALQVAVRGDTSDEPNEAFVVTLTGATGATIQRGTAQGTILDNDGRPALCLPIAVVPITISSSGSYCFVAHLVYPDDTGSAIDVAADGVRLDLKGFELAGNGSAFNQAVGIHAAGRQDVVVRNGTLRAFLSGLRFEDANGASSGHLVEKVRAADNLLSGIWVEGLRSTLRNNFVLGSGGTSVLGGNGDGFGIVARGAEPRVLGNDVIQTLGVGSGRGVGIDVRHGGGAFVERNRISNTALAAGTFGILLSSADRGLMVTGNRLGQLDWGIVFGSANGPYQGNLASQVTTPYAGGTAAGKNQ